MYNYEFFNEEKRLVEFLNKHTQIEIVHIQYRYDEYEVEDKRTKEKLKGKDTIITLIYKE